MFRIALRIVGSIQIVLGLAYLLAPEWLLLAIGHSPPAPDLRYPLGMLAARFLAYGAGLWIASGAPERHLLWIRLMALIQLIDLLVGVFHTLNGTVPWSLSAFPIVNALWIGALFFWWRPARALAAPEPTR